LTRNELDLTFWVPDLRCKVSSKLIENCDRRRVDRQTDVTDTGDFIICPMLCYSNGTDNKLITLRDISVTSCPHVDSAWDCGRWITPVNFSQTAGEIVMPV